MSAVGLESIDHTVQLTHIWINDLDARLGWENAAESRAVANIDADPAQRLRRLGKPGNVGSPSPVERSHSVLRRGLRKLSAHLRR